MNEEQRIGDELAIRDLVATFAEAVNDMRPHGMSQIFTPDAEFVIRGWTSMSGIGEIVGFLTGVLGHWNMIMQAVHSGRITITDDEATGSWYVTEYGRYRDGYEVYLGGRYFDGYVRTAAGWRFARREFRGMFRRTVPASPGLVVQPPDGGLRS